MAKTEKDKVVWAELQRQLGSMDLRVKRGTIQDATFIELKQNQDRPPKNREVLMPRPAAVEMVLGLRKAMNSISVTSFIKKLISTTAGYEKLKLLLRRCMIFKVKSICLFEGEVVQK